MGSNTASFTFSIPKNTPAKLEIVEVLTGKLESIHVSIPSGHKGLAGLNISIPGGQVVPSLGSGDNYVKGDGQEMTFSPGVFIDGPPYKLLLRGYNNDPFLEHAFVVRVTTGSL